jgi:hypothetical protein
VCVCVCVCFLKAHSAGGVKLSGHSCLNHPATLHVWKQHRENVITDHISKAKFKGGRVLKPSLLEECKYHTLLWNPPVREIEMRWDEISLKVTDDEKDWEQSNDTPGLSSVWLLNVIWLCCNLIGYYKSGSPDMERSAGASVKNV